MEESMTQRRSLATIGGKDVFGNRFCHENCSVVSMSRKGEPVQGFEIVLASSPDEALEVLGAHLGIEHVRAGVAVEIIGEAIAVQIEPVGTEIAGIADAIGGMIFPGAMKTTISFVLFILILLFKPTGLFGSKN